MAELKALQADDPASLGGYRLLGRLGSGGQGVVYLGRGASPERQVAIKLLHARLIEDAAARLRFVRELAVVQRVAGFCTAQVLEADVAGDRPYIVSEYVPGPSLQDLVRDFGPRTGSDLDRLAIGTVTALAAIHRSGIVHRDFKPPNVLMAPDGPRVIDFGIARALDTFTSLTSQMIGTPAYMAPEQLIDDKAGPASDLFTWAATMLYAATGHSPFEGPSLPAVAYRILNFSPDLSALPGQLAEQVAACLAKDPSLRPQAEEVLLRLLGTGTGNGSSADRSPNTPAVVSPEPRTPGAGTIPQTAIGQEAASPQQAVPPPGPTPQDPAVRPAAPAAAQGRQPAPPPTLVQRDTPPMPGPEGAPPGWPAQPRAVTPGGPPEMLGVSGQAPAGGPRAGQPHGTAWLPPAESGATLLQLRPAKTRLHRTPALLSGLALAFLCALLDVAAFVFNATPSSPSASNRASLLLVTGGFALLGLITMIAVAFALRGGRAATWTVLGTTVVHMALWGIWSLSLPFRPDEALINLGAPALGVALLGYALWRDRSRPVPPGPELAPPW